MQVISAVGAAGAGVQGGGAGETLAESIGHVAGEARRSTAVVQQSIGGARAEHGSRIQDGNINYANIGYANIEVGNYNGWIPLTTLTPSPPSSASDRI